MAKTNKRLACNVAGDFFVDDSCIDCGACRWLAPQVFDREGTYAYVAHQPGDAMQADSALAALVACPAIGGGGTQVAEAASHFPRLWPRVSAAHGVYAVRFHSRDTFGAASWLIVRAGGNVLVDCPRYDSRLADRILHTRDITDDTAAVEHPIHGTDPIDLADAPAPATDAGAYRGGPRDLNNRHKWVFCSVGA